MSDLASLVLSSRGVYDEVISRQQNEIHALNQAVKTLTPKEPPKFYFDTDEEWETAKDNLFNQIRTIIDNRWSHHGFGYNRNNPHVFMPMMWHNIMDCAGSGGLSDLTFQGVHINVSGAYVGLERAFKSLQRIGELHLSDEEAKDWMKQYFLDSVFDRMNENVCLLNDKTVFIRCLPCCRFLYEDGYRTNGCCEECEQFETKGIVQRVEDAQGCLKIKYSIAARKIQRMVNSRKTRKRKASCI